MPGILGIDTYFPRRRLDRALIGKAWGMRVPGGTRTVAGIDEDALTMATDAVLGCLDETDADTTAVDALYFASTSSPYAEKQVASVISTAADLPRSIAVADFAGSVRAGLGALRAALDGVRAGTLRTALVAAADARVAEPESELEPLLGDGAAALLVGAGDGVIAELVASASVSEEFTCLWRTDAQRTVQVTESRFGSSYGYARDVGEAIGLVLRKAELPPGRVAALALGAPDARAAADAAKRAGCDPARLAPSLLAEAGIIGSAEPLALLSRCLETAAPGDFLVAAGWGEGADALVFRATERLPAARPRPLAERLARGLPLPSYERYLRARGVLPADVPGEAMTSITEWKELKQDVRLYASRCGTCELVQYPQAQVCLACRGRNLVDHKLGRRGTVFTFTIDNLAPVAEHPLPMAVIDLDGGGRVYLQVADAAEGEVKVGVPVTLTFRRLHEAGGNRNYFWKARPA